MAVGSRPPLFFNCYRHLVGPSTSVGAALALVMALVIWAVSAAQAIKAEMAFWCLLIVPL